MAPKTAHLQVEYRLSAELNPYIANARLHSNAQVRKIAASIERFGFNNPILIDAGDTIVAGHGRLMAAKLLGLAEVPVIQLGHLTDAERRAYTIADNRIAEDAKWDMALLERELRAVVAEGIDAVQVGFSDAEIERLLRDAQGGSGRDPNQAPAIKPDPVSRPGDLWRMGGHRLLCGDSTAAADVSRVLGGERPNLMVTDQPYGVNYDPNWRNEAARTSPGMGNRIGAGAIGKVQNDHRADWREVWKLFPGHVAYVWHGGLHSATVQASLEAAGYQVRAQIMWLKQRLVISRGHYHWQHEPALYAVRDGEDDGWRFVPEHEVAAYAVLKGETADWHGGRKQSTVWEIEHVKSETGHGTQKPVECMRRPMINNSSRGDCVFEPFSGSGTSIIAGQMCERRVLAIEIDPAYVDVAVRRWQDFTGGHAILDGDGRTFADIAAARGVALAA
ncbi:MAG: site-specific DNA-methyltransferase [Pseudorhodoplanes sp.]|uniref:site-specific DNA-methyltransferase n=1 Tax=Pseudorhodoplanes sp. TaxID=1934341 RepID=UPI003D0FB6C9